MEGKYCAPQHSSLCPNSTFPNGTKTPDFCEPGWLCDESSPHAGYNATCKLKNVCGNSTQTNVCSACAKDYIKTQQSCDECVTSRCSYCDPSGPRGCFNACDKCCAAYIDDCGACIAEECHR